MSEIIALVNGVPVDRFMRPILNKSQWQEDIDRLKASNRLEALNGVSRRLESLTPEDKDLQDKRSGLWEEVRREEEQLELDKRHLSWFKHWQEPSNIETLVRDTRLEIARLIKHQRRMVRVFSDVRGLERVQNLITRRQLKIASLETNLRGLVSYSSTPEASNGVIKIKGLTLEDANKLCVAMDCDLVGLKKILGQ